MRVRERARESEREQEGEREKTRKERKEDRDGGKKQARRTQPEKQREDRMKAGTKEGIYFGEGVVERKRSRSKLSLAESHTEHGACERSNNLKSGGRVPTLYI